PPEPVLPPRVTRADRGIVEQAEAHGRGNRRMVPRRTDDAERAASLLFHRRVHGSDSSASREFRDVEGFRAHARIDIDERLTAPAYRFDFMNQILTVAQRDVLVGRRLGHNSPKPS